MAWREVLTDGRAWDEARDRDRIRKAFITLARTRRQWPAPVDFLEALPRYIPELTALPSKPTDPDKARRVIADLAAELGMDRKTRAAGGGE